MGATVARREVTRIRDLTREANQLERDISQQVTQLVPSLLKIPGCGALSAAQFLGEAADIARFKSRDAYAMWAGVAPNAGVVSQHRTFGLVSVTAG
jgi:transposase